MLNAELITRQLREACGIFGIFEHQAAGELVYYGLHSLQHRGQESAGIVAVNQGKFVQHRGLGLVTEVFANKDMLRTLSGTAIGHVRYALAGAGEINEAQPLLFRYRQGTIALAHNGLLTNAIQLRNQLERQGSIFQTNSDIEVIAHLIARSSANSVEEALLDALQMVDGAYALVLLTEDKIIACLDPHGLRPLSIGKIDESFCVASETCAFDLIQAEFIRHVQPGEMVIIDRKGLRSVQISPPKPALCAFEYIYFARPDSYLGQRSVHQVRKQLGRQLALEQPAAADLVLGVPDSSLPAAMGYAEGAKIPFEFGLIKNRYVGRTFIGPKQELRNQGVRMKLSVVEEIVAGKSVVIVDDSLVRGTTSSRIVRLLRDAGVREVHVRISAPPVIYPCFYGIDIRTQKELIMTQKTIEQIREYINADSLKFISVPGMISCISGNVEQHGLCLACFTGEYPTKTNSDVHEVIS